MSSPILVLGKNGQIGSALAVIGADKVIAIDKEEADLSKPEALSPILKEIAPCAIINAAAYTAVDKAEEEQELAIALNAEAPKALAVYCKEAEIPLVHYSTDYVYAGEGMLPNTEESETRPLNIYGKSKLAGEKYIEEVGCEHIILRTSWVYDAIHKNFFNTMMKLAQEREEISVVYDQIGAPTYAPHIAYLALNILNNQLNQIGFNSGVYNFCGGGEVSWHGFAEEIFNLARKNNIELKISNLKAIATEEYPTPAKRPLNSRLDCSKVLTIFGVQMPLWQESLKACMEKYIENN